MSNQVLMKLKFRIDKRYNNEAKIMLDIIEGYLTQEELTELTSFMNNHPFAKVSNDLINKRNNRLTR